MSGLKINYHKSNIYGIGVPDGIVTNFASKLNCMKISLPFTYLSLPLGANPRRKSTWATIIEKCQRRLASWKRRFISFGGRLTLIRSVLSSLPVYYMSLFKLLEGVARAIDRIQAFFLWGGSNLKRKIRLVKWEEVTKSKKQGGIRVRKVRDVNDCLLAKW